MLSSSHKAKRDLLTKMSSIRNTDGGSVVRRNYTYDRLGRPVTRQTLRSGGAMNETFDYDDRSESTRRLAGRLDKSAAFAPKGENCRRLEGRLAKSDRFCPNGVRSREATPQASIDGAMLSQLTGALLDENAYTYAYDNIGNREIAQEVAEGITYAANDLNQYTRISTNGENFTPEYDEDGNQTLIQTSTGIWKVQYNAQNRAIKFESEDGHTVITCGYDYMGRRFEKKVVTNGTTTLHERYIYRGYLQIAAYDLREGHAEHPDLRFIIWDPTQEVATRPLAIRENGVWYTYGWDLTKNICELYGQEGFIRTIYTYSPYGQVRENESTTQSPRGIGGGLDNAEALPEGRTADGAAVSQPIQWSSEMYDAELGLVYYNYRYYNPTDGRWTRRDPVGEFSVSLNLFNFSSPQLFIDLLGLKVCCSGNKPKVKDQAQRECCEEEMQEVAHMTRPPSLRVGNTCFSGHEYIKTKNMQKGLYPSSSIKALSLLPVEGVVRDEEVKKGDRPVQTFKACPESVKAVEKQLKENQESPPEYQLTNSFGGMNCVGYATHVLQSAGFTSTDSDRWIPQATLDAIEENMKRWISDYIPSSLSPNEPLPAKPFLIMPPVF